MDSEVWVDTASDCFSYEKLRVWRKAVDFATWIYKVTKLFPRDEVFGLTSQLRRAAVSVSANIAEGASCSSGRDRARFVEIAYGSLNEIATVLHIARDQEMITADDLAFARAQVSDMCRMLSGLRRRALDDTSPATR